MPQQLKSKALSGAMWMLAQNLGAQVSALIVFILLARLLTPRDFGLMAMAFVVTQFLTMFASQGLISAIIQRQDLEQSHLDTAFWLNLSVGLIVAMIGMAAAPGIALLYGEPAVSQILMVLCITVLLESLTSVQNSILQRRMEFKNVAIRKLSGEAVGGAAGITMALSGFGIWSLVARPIINQITQVLLFWLLTDWRPRLLFSVPHLKDIVGYGSNVLGVNVLNFGARQFDSFLIGLFMGATVLGQYSIAKRLIMMLVDLVRGGIGSVAWTMFSRIQDQQQKLQQGLMQLNRMVCLITFPLFIAVSLYSHHYIPLFFGEKWYASIPIIQLLALAGFFEATRSCHESLILATGKSGVRLMLAAVIASANIGIFFMLYEWDIVVLSFGYGVVALVLFPFWVRATITPIELSLGSYIKSYKEPVFATLALVVTHFTIDALVDQPLINPNIDFLIEIVFMGILYLAIITAINPRLLVDLIREKRKN